MTNETSYVYIKKLEEIKEHLEKCIEYDKKRIKWHKIYCVIDLILIINLLIYLICVVIITVKGF